MKKSLAEINQIHHRHFHSRQQKEGSCLMVVGWGLIVTAAAIAFQFFM